VIGRFGVKVEGGWVDVRFRSEVPTSASGVGGIVRKKKLRLRGVSGRVVKGV
jgi:hypothetical protein